LQPCLERVEREDQDVDADSGECSGLDDCQFQRIDIARGACRECKSVAKCICVHCQYNWDV
jgi:hypothetical protein